MRIKREAILWYAIQYDGDWKKIGNAIKAHENYSIIAYPYPYLTIVDEMYPEAFKHLRYPPWIIFYQGNVCLLKEKGVGIVGARNCSVQALQIRIQSYKGSNQGTSLYLGLPKVLMPGPI